MKKIDDIITEHLGDDWHRFIDQIPIIVWKVLIDRLQEEKYSLRRVVWQILAIAALKDRFGFIWLQQPSQNRLYVMDLISLWGDLSGASDYWKQFYDNDSINPSFNWSNLLYSLRAAIEQSGLDSSNLPS
jgi:hypothetical protein